MILSVITMNVCIISENSYPVSTGGVSEWCKSLVSELTEYNFQIITIAPNSEIKYKIPDNVEINIIEMNKPSFVTEFVDDPAIHRIMEPLKALVKGEALDVQKLYDCISKERVSAKELISSSENNERLLSYYNQNYAGRPFVPFYYSWTSLYYLLYGTLELVNEIPKTELFHALNSGYAGLLGCIGKVSTGSPLLINEHGLYLKERLFELEHSEVPRWLHSFYEMFFKSLVKTSYRYSDQVISVCRDHVSHQRKIYSKIKPNVVYNGIDVNKFKFDYKEGSDHPSIGTVSRITPIKDQLTLIRSIPDVVEKNNATFYIVGDIQDQEYYDECVELAHELGVIDNIVFTGFQDSSAWYSKFDVFVLPSLSEGFPLTLLEALSTGTPCIATNVGGVPEILDEQFLVDKWDPSELASKINWLLQADGIRRKIAHRGRELVERRFNVENMVSGYQEVYESMV